MNNLKAYLVVCSALLLILSFFPLNSYGTQSVYTIQTGSFGDIASAQRAFDSIVEKLNEKELDYLRIEKIGKFYSVRLGKFEDSTAAENFFQPLKSRLPEAIIMSAYFKDERIKKLYKPAAVIERPVKEWPLTTPRHEIIKPPDTDKTIQEVDKHKEEEPLEIKIKKISALVEKKDYEEALEVINAEIARQPESPELNGWYGTVFLKMNNPDEAIKYLQKAAKLSPDVPDYHSGLGYCLFFLNRLNEAIEEFNKAVNLNPAHIDALTGLGVAYAKTGKREKAVDVYKKLKELDMDTANKLLKIIEGT